MTGAKYLIWRDCKRYKKRKSLVFWTAMRIYGIISDWEFYMERATGSRQKGVRFFNTRIEPAPARARSKRRKWIGC